MRKLDKTISIIYAVILSVIISIGGVSVYLSSTILHKLQEIEEESEHVVIVKRMYKDVYRLVLAMHHFLVHAEKPYLEEMSLRLSSIESQVKDYIVIEEAEKYEEKNLEIDYLELMLTNIDKLKDYVNHVSGDFSRTDKFDRKEFQGSEQFAYNIEIYAEKINEIHFKKIAEWEKQALASMQSIIYLFIAFSGIGLMAFYIGYKALSKTIVKPIRVLADTTLEFSQGAFDKRVRSNSKTEIGLLYQSFNKMAECVQSRDTLLTQFNDELEKKIEERTRELRKANENLQRAQNRLITAEKISAIGEIATGVAHEIKNPLNSLSINMQGLLREIKNACGADGCRFYETAEIILYEVKRMNNILDSFVSYAKFPEPKFMENDINRIIGEVVTVIFPEAEGANITLELSLSDTLPAFTFDRPQIKEVIMNLVQNAFQAMPQGGILTIRTFMREGNIVIEISDTGTGIPEKNLDKIFMLFFTTREAGLGLGLAIVKRIVERHGGRITCSSKTGVGTTFEVTLPLQIN